VVVVVGNLATYSGSTSTALNAEVAVVEITAQGSPASIVEGYIDLSAMTDTDEATVIEYIALDGVTYVKFLEVLVQGAPASPLIRFHSKIIPSGAKYKVAVLQTAGAAFSVNYWFSEQQLAVS